MPSLSGFLIYIKDLVMNQSTDEVQVCLNIDKYYVISSLLWCFQPLKLLLYKFKATI